MIGLDLVARACFNPAAAPGVFQRLAAHDEAQTRGRGAGASFFSTHPSHGDRIAQFRALMPESVQKVHRFCADRDDFMLLLAKMDGATKYS